MLFRSDFYKTLEENQVSTGDLMMLKNAYIRLKSWQDLNIKRHEKEFLPNYNHSIKAGFSEDIKLEMMAIKRDNELYLAKIDSEVKALDTIIEKLKGIID